jgi:membrane-associated phospholipid phosphatase
MDRIQTVDEIVFRFVNQQLSNPFFDWLMPFVSGNPYFYPVLAGIAVWLLTKGGFRGRVCFGMLILAVAAGDPLVVNTLKNLIGRPRPFMTIEDANVLGAGRMASFSMPSGHAANWFTATMVACIYYRKLIWAMLPMAILVSFSRIYNGVHYLTDVTAGAALGAGFGAGMVWAVDAIWTWLGPRWFPLWFRTYPSFLRPELARAPTPVLEHELQLAQKQWLRLGYLAIFAMLTARLAYLATGRLELSEDEAYQWVWSKHLALSYYSKPPLIAYTQWLGTHIWGDTVFGVRFFSPVLAAALSLLVLRFIARERSAQLGFWLILMVDATPLLAVGSFLMTIDPLSVFFWTLAIITGWRAVQLDSTQQWARTGLWMGLGFLSKYTALFQLLCWAVFFLLCPDSRRQLRRPGPYLALGIMTLCTLPVLIWNAQHDWITLDHMASRSGLDQEWRFQGRFIWDFVLAEVGLLNPIWFGAVAWAAIRFWRRGRDPFLVYLFSMGAPVFLIYLLYTVRARVQPNWIAPAVIPLFCLGAIYWWSRWREGLQPVKYWVIAGLSIGIPAVVLLHDTNIVNNVVGRPLPAEIDPLRRVRAWKETARLVGEARTNLLQAGKPVFIIGDHYGITGLLSFYLPEAKQNVPNDPLVFARSSDKPENQFYFWKGYAGRTGQNAIYVSEDNLSEIPSPRLQREFASVRDLGVKEALYRGRVFHRLRLFECRDLR